MLVVTLRPPFGPDDTYWKMWKAVWTPDLGGVLNIEQDIDGGVNRELPDCPHDWCAKPYPYLDRERQFGLGYVKFSAALISRHPDLWDVIGRWSNPQHPPRHWCTLDAFSYAYLTSHGEQRHEAHTSVLHAGHPGAKSSAHGCFQIP